MNNIRESLKDEIQTEIEKLSDVDFGSNEYKAGVDGVAKLMDKAIELEKIEAEDDKNRRSREFEHEKFEFEKKKFMTDDGFKREQANSEKIGRLITNSISIAGIIIPSVITIWGTVKTLKFEETGTVTTMAGRGFVSRLFSKK